MAATRNYNGLAERTHSVSINMARAMLASAPYLDPNKHWKDAHQLAILIRNLTPMPILGNKCPWELWHGTMPREFPVLLPFGTKLYYHTKDKAKFHQRTTEGLYMGPAIDVVGGAIKVYALETRKIIITRSYRVEELPSATPPLSAADGDTNDEEEPMPYLTDDEDEGYAEPPQAAANRGPQPVNNRGENANRRASADSDTEDSISSGPSTPPTLTPRTLIRQLAAAGETPTDPDENNIDNRELRGLRNITAAAFNSPPVSRLRNRAQAQGEQHQDGTQAQGEQHQRQGQVQPAHS